MRSQFIVLLVFLAVIAVFGQVLINDPGYIMASYGGYVVETSLFFLALAGLFFFVLFLITMMVLNRVFGLKSRVTQWFSSREVRGARQKTTLGLIELAEGNWVKARKLLDEAAEEHDHPLINYLSAARAADEMDDIEGRDRYLQLAMNTKVGNPDLAVGLTQAQLEYHRKEWERCLATLVRLKEKAPQHPYVMKMLVEVYQKTEEWELLFRLLSKIRKSKSQIMEFDEIERLELMATQNWLRSVIRRRGGAEGERAAQLDQVWRQIPKNLQRQSAMIQTFCECCLDIDQNEWAVEKIEAQLKIHWSDKLALLYGSVPVEDPFVAMSVVKEWLEAHPDNPALYTTLGRLAMRAEKWQQAEAYFEKALSLKKTPELLGELARLNTAQGLHMKSNDYFSQGMAMLVHGLPDLPLPSINKVSEAEEAVATS